MKIVYQSHLLLLASTLFTATFAECPNDCSGHGQCGSHDMCTCDRNWQGEDCSLRTCPFGLAHVDISKGDLDSSLSIGSSSTVVITDSTVYPFGTTEGYPQMADTAGTIYPNTGHEYAECSNKGLCDRKFGECLCYAGYEGSACQRASCPSQMSLNNPGPSITDLSSLFGNQYPSSSSSLGSTPAANLVFSGPTPSSGFIPTCSGHGVCQSISAMASSNGDDQYNLWDKHSTMGCACDPGYTGADCSERICKYGIDPLWIDDSTARVTQTTVHYETSVANTLSGKYALIFFDVFGEDYVTTPLTLSPTGAGHCNDVTAALKALPNGVIPDIQCSLQAINTNFGFEYTLTFTGNPGKLKTLQLNEYLDGSRPTVLVSSGTYTSQVYTKVDGEFIDYVADRCEGVKLKVLIDADAATNAWGADVRPGSLGYLSDLTPMEEKLLKACLGDADYNPDNNVDVANWDMGVLVETDSSGSYNMIGAFPHLVRIVPVETSAGYNRYTYSQYHLVWYDETATAGKRFRIANVNNNVKLLTSAAESYIYTTRGTLQQLGWGTGSELADNLLGGASTPRIVGYFSKGSNKIYTNYDTSCANQPSGGPRNHVCIKRGDLLFLVDSCWGKGQAGAATPFFGGPLLYNCPDSTAPHYHTANMYTVSRVYTVPLSSSKSTTSPATKTDVTADATDTTIVDTYVIEIDANFGWQGLMGDPENSDTSGNGTTWSDNTGIVPLFHFSPPSMYGSPTTSLSSLSTSSTGAYQYVNECSNRGNCDRSSGLCACFRGYTGDDCSIQNVLSI